MPVVPAATEAHEPGVGFSWQSSSSETQIDQTKKKNKKKQKKRPVNSWILVYSVCIWSKECIKYNCVVLLLLQRLRDLVADGPHTTAWLLVQINAEHSMRSDIPPKP